MPKEITIYKSYGVLAHEKEPFYSWGAPASDIYDRVTVIIPYAVWESVSTEPGITINGTDYLISEILNNWGDKPALCWYDGVKHNHVILDIVN